VRMPLIWVVPPASSFLSCAWATRISFAFDNACSRCWRLHPGVVPGLLAVVAAIVANSVWASPAHLRSGSSFRILAPARGALGDRLRDRASARGYQRRRRRPPQTLPVWGRWLMQSCYLPSSSSPTHGTRSRPVAPIVPTRHSSRFQSPRRWPMRSHGEPASRSSSRGGAICADGSPRDAWRSRPADVGEKTLGPSLFTGLDAATLRVAGASAPATWRPLCLYLHGFVGSPTSLLP
jgi:hypothetical protein